jgi:hypothetical protein
MCFTFTLTHTYAYYLKNPQIPYFLVNLYVILKNILIPFLVNLYMILKNPLIPCYLVKTPLIPFYVVKIHYFEVCTVGVLPYSFLSKKIH